MQQLKAKHETDIRKLTEDYEMMLVEARTKYTDLQRTREEVR